MADEQHQCASHDGNAPGDQAPPRAASVAPPPAAVAGSAIQEAHDEEEEEEKAAVPAATTEQENAEVAQPSASEKPLVTVNLKFIHCERLSVQCARDILISELKKRVLELYTRHAEGEEEKTKQQSDGIQVEAMAQSTPSSSSESDMAPLRLIYKGKVLKDDLALAAYNFVDDDTIHAVFGRPHTSASEAASGAAPTATSSATETRNSTGGVMTTANGIQDMGNGVVLGQFSLDTGENSPFPEIGSFFNTILSSFTGGSGEGPTTSIRITTSDLPASVASPSTVASSATAAAGAPFGSTTMSSASTTASATASSTADTSSAATPTVSGAPVSTSLAPPTSITAVRYSIPIGPPQAQSPPPSTNVTGNAASLLNQAASLRRMIPALELSPLSQPLELSSEMYALGNAMREASDTFLAVHRQLQFVATRFLSENNLNDSERLRLRTRVHQLVSILDQVGSLSRAVSINLATSSYGPLAQAFPAQVNRAVSQQPSSTQSSQPPTTATATPPVQSTPSVSVSPTVNIFSGGNAPGASAPNVGNSITEILQAVNGLVGGATSTSTSSTSQQSSVSGNLGNLLNLVSALASNGARPGQNAMPPNGSGVQGPAIPPSPSPPVSVPLGNVQQPTNTTEQASAAAASIPNQPLSALFTQVRTSRAC